MEKLKQKNAKTRFPTYHRTSPDRRRRRLLPPVVVINFGFSYRGKPCTGPTPIVFHHVYVYIEIVCIFLRFGYVLTIYDVTGDAY